MSDSKQTKYQAWLQMMLRKSGEELIRRSEQMSFENWDLISGARIVIDIPHYSDDSLPDMTVSFKLIPKEVCDYILEHGYEH